jgi:hypothetical protein
LTARRGVGCAFPLIGEIVSKRASKKKGRRKKKGNHGKRPNAG